jgi:DNA-binding NtrC family response regulator
MTLQTNKRLQEGAIQVFPRGTVLLVDADPKSLGYLRSVLQAAGYNVQACNSFLEGARCLDGKNFDLIIVSQGTRNFEGRSVLERAMEIDRQMPVVVTARCIDMDCYLEAMQLGAVDYLEEPVAVTELVRVVGNHLRPRRAAKLARAAFQ